MKFILGKKLGMTQVFRDNGIVVPVTRVVAGPCVVTQVKAQGKNTVSAVQIGYGAQKQFRLSKAKQGHLKGLATVNFLRDFRAEDQGLERGDTFTVKIFTPGEKVQVTGTSKGKGFQGVVKRHNFKGSPKTHGHKDQHRMPGSIGATDAARVFKGTRMGGHMGDDRVTVTGLEIIEVLAEENELLIKGAIPGARGNLLLISTEEGNIEIEQPVEEVAEEKAVENVPEVKEEVTEKVETEAVVEDKK
jgi:large subunit ribosomal protein L3